MEISLSHRYTADEAQYMSISRVDVLLISGTLLGRTSYIVADSPWPNHMDDSGLVSSTMSPPLGATRHGRTLVCVCLGAQFRQIAGQRRSRARTGADGGRGMAQRAGALELTEGFSLIWCLCLANNTIGQRQKGSETDAVDTKTAEEDRVPSGEVGRRRRLAVGQTL